jgi:hypothetical protein
VQTSFVRVVHRETRNLWCGKPALREHLLLSLVLDQHEFDEYQNPNLNLSLEQLIRLIPTKQLGI